ncbi:MAG: hypothetical protein LBL25_00450 [Oscillospiraceae bacterium]|jgi:hypothetical protein|nr:hypothetical protein [Oscillospiraceae bacterium]
MNYAAPQGNTKNRRPEIDPKARPESSKGGNQMHDHPSHGDAHGAAKSREEAEALLQFTLRHNRSHEEELHELGHSLEALGLSAAAEEVRYSLDDSKCATEHIERAIASLTS